MKIAYFTPLSDNDPVLQEYCINLISNLNGYMEIAVFIEKSQQIEKFVNDFNVYSCEKFESLNKTGEFDLILYDMADKKEHFYIYPFIKNFSGVAVLHDYSYHQIFVHIDSSQNNESLYIKELTKNYGNISNSIAFRHDNNIWTEMDDFLYPNNSEIICNSLGIIVHNDILKTRIIDQYPSIRVRHINYAVKAYDYSSEKQNAKEKMDIKYYNFVFGVFPNTDKVDRLDIILRAFKELIQKFPDSILLIVGEILDKGMYNTIDNLDMWEKIKIIDPSPKNVFDCMLATDIAFEFSNPITKTVPMNMLKLMAYSTPVVIFNYVSFNEIPDDCCIKIDTLIGDTITENIINSISPVIVNHKLRDKLGNNAKNYTSNYHSFKGIADEYCDFINEIFQNSLKNKELITYYNRAIDQIIFEAEALGMNDGKILVNNIIKAQKELFP